MESKIFFVIISILYSNILYSEESELIMPVITENIPQEIIKIDESTQIFRNIYLDDITDNYLLSPIPAQKLEGSKKNTETQVSEELIANEIKNDDKDVYNFQLKADFGYSVGNFAIKNSQYINKFTGSQISRNINLALELRYKKIAIEYDLFMLNNANLKDKNLSVSTLSLSAPSLSSFSSHETHHNLRTKIFMIDNSFFRYDFNFGLYLVTMNYSLNYSGTRKSNNSSGISKLITYNESARFNKDIVGGQVGSGFLFKFSEHYNAYLDLRYIVPIKNLDSNSSFQLNSSSFNSYIIRFAFENHIILNENIILNLAIRYHIERLNLINKSTITNQNFNITNNIIMFNLGLILRI